jgi:hypothetical protein
LSATQSGVRGNCDVTVEVVQYFAAVFVQAAKPRGAGEADFVQVGQEEADLGRGGTTRSAHRVIDADDRAGVIDSACQWFFLRPGIHAVIVAVAVSRPYLGRSLGVSCRSRWSSLGVAVVGRGRPSRRMPASR